MWRTGSPRTPTRRGTRVSQRVLIALAVGSMMVLLTPTGTTLRSLGDSASALGAAVDNGLVTESLARARALFDSYAQPLNFSMTRAGEWSQGAGRWGLVVMSRRRRAGGRGGGWARVGGQLPSAAPTPPRTHAHAPTLVCSPSGGSRGAGRLPQGAGSLL